MPTAPQPSAVLQISSRGQITLPAQIRRALDLRPGDTVLLKVREGQAILEPAVVLPVEIYSEERIREFEDAASMSPEELQRVRRKWRV